MRALSPQKRTRLGLALVALLAFAVFAPTLGGGFVYDDLYQIGENDQIRSLRNLPRFFTADVWAAVGMPSSSYYRPLMYTTFAVETAIAGPVPWIFRTTNALLHAAVSVLLALLLLRLGHSPSAALAAGALFAVHPMHAEVVGWPSARPELLVTLFTLGAAYVYAASDPVSGPTRGRFLATGALVMLALLSKETGLLAPVLIALVALQRAGGTALRRLSTALRSAAPYLALVVLFVGLRGLAIRTGPAPPLVGDTVSDAVLRIAAIAGRYLGVMLVPIEASSFRVPSWDHVWWGLAVLPLAGAALALAPRRREAGWLAFAFLGIALQSVGVPSAGYLAQRYAYLPSVGVCAFLALVLAGLLLDAASARRRRIGLAALAATLVAWTLLLLPRSFEWASSPRLWQAAIERDPDSPTPIANHGYSLLGAGRTEEALALFRRLERVQPGQWAAPCGEARALVAMGRLEEAIPFFEKAIARAPEIPLLSQSLAEVYEQLGQLDKAREAYDRALAVFPESSLAEGSRSALEARAGDSAEALARTEKALALRGDRLELRLNRVALLARNGRVDEAIAEAEALTADPRAAAEAHAHLGVLFDRYRPDPARAIEHYREALRLRPDRPDAAQLQRRVAALERSQRR